MVTEARKLHVIEQVLKIKSEEKLAAIEDFIGRTLKKSKKGVRSESPFQEFAGIWSKEEAAEIENAIAESCETINPDDWK